MAEAVQARLERSLDELHEYRRYMLFTDPEIKAIVVQRKGFEYALRRRQTRYQDFIAFIDYETELEMQRRERKAKRGIRKTLPNSDFAITRHLHNLYQRALQKFKGEMPLWEKYFDFCYKFKSYRQLGKAFATCLQFHGHHPDVWIQAAKFEFDINRDMKAVRSLLQRGLRANKNHQGIWLEYFRSELRYWNIMHQRAVTLGILDKDGKERAEMTQDDSSEPSNKRSKMSKRGKAAAQAASDGEEKDDESDLGATGSGSDEDNDEVDEDDMFDQDEEEKEAQDMMNLIAPPQEDDAEEKADQDAAARAVELAHQVGQSFLSGVVPRIVYFNAIEQNPEDFDFIAEFLSIYRAFAHTEPSRTQIYDMLPRDNPKAIALLCRRPLEDHPDDAQLQPEQWLDAINESSRLFRELLETTDDKALVSDEYIKFLSSALPTVQASEDVKVLNTPNTLSPSILCNCVKRHLRCLFVLTVFADINEFSISADETDSCSLVASSYSHPVGACASTIGSSSLHNSR
eukprot:m.115426 g.115426  ORF g.115426 m.115426 type:complete len:516 (-) comp13565_c0_seq2:1063-2610(-)